jgi:hypothetical protein
MGISMDLGNELCGIIVQHMEHGKWWKMRISIEHGMWKNHIKSLDLDLKWLHWIVQRCTVNDLYKWIYTSGFKQRIVISPWCPHFSMISATMSCQTSRSMDLNQQGCEYSLARMAWTCGCVGFWSTNFIYGHVQWDIEWFLFFIHPKY